MASFIIDFGILFIIIGAVSFVVKILRQPIIIGYILSGFFFSVYFSAKSTIGDQLPVLAEIGITFLLFLMGLEFDLESLTYLGKDLIFGVILQSLAFFAVEFVPAWIFGFGMAESTYLAILFMFSSTLLVAKWLSDKKETATLKG